MPRVVTRAYLDEWNGSKAGETPVEAELPALLFALDRLDQSTHTTLNLEFGTTGDSLLIGGGLNRFIFSWTHPDETTSTLWKVTLSLESRPAITIGGQPAEFDPLIVLSRETARQALRDFLNAVEPTSDLCWLTD